MLGPRARENRRAIEMDKFLNSIDLNGPIIVQTLGRCHIWTGKKNNHGYGVIPKILGERLAHRMAWKIKNGFIPKGEGYHGTCILHRCDNPECVREEHLFIGTQAENMRDRRAKRRGPMGKTHHASKLDDQKVQAIRNSFKGNYGEESALARQFGVTRQAIWFVVHGKSWNHIDGKKSEISLDNAQRLRDR